MARKTKLGPLMLDTSAVVYYLRGHTLQQKAIQQATAGRVLIVPVFVRMEYLRGLILNLVEMWCLIRESVHVQDAFIDWSQKIKQERKLKSLLLTVPQWLGDQDQADSKELTLRRLGDQIIGMIRDFDEAFPSSSDDPLGCVLGRVSIAFQTYDEDLLLEFYARFTAIQEGTPDCQLCPFRKRSLNRLRRRKLSLTRESAENTFPANTGFHRQCELIEQAAQTEDQTPSCRWCERLGDAIISLQANTDVSIITADRTFVPFGQLLGFPVVLLPSLAELKKAAR